MWISSNFFIVGVEQFKKLATNNNFSFSPSSYMLKTLSNEFVTQNIFYTTMILLLDRMSLFFYCEIFLSLLCAFVVAQFFLIFQSILPSMRGLIKTIQKLSAILIFFLSYFFIFRKKGNKIIKKIKSDGKKMIAKGVSLETEKAMDKFLDSIDPKVTSSMEESFLVRIEDSIKIIKTMNESQLVPIISNKFSIFFVSILHSVIVNGLGSILMKIVPFYTGDDKETTMERIRLMFNEFRELILTQVFGKEKCVSELFNILECFQNIRHFLNILAKLVPICALIGSFLLTILVPSFSLQSDSKSTFLSMINCLPTAKSTDIEGNLIKISEKISIKDLGNKVWVEFIFIGLLFFVSLIFIFIILLSYKNIVKNVNTLIDFSFLNVKMTSFLDIFRFAIFGFKIVEYDDGRKEEKAVDFVKDAEDLSKLDNGEYAKKTGYKERIATKEDLSSLTQILLVKVLRVAIIFWVLGNVFICIPQFYDVFRGFFYDLNNYKKIVSELMFLSCIPLVKTEGVPVENIISFKADNVDLCYFPGDPIVNANFAFKAGTMNFIYGESGSGKTTIVKSLLNYIITEKNTLLCSNGFEIYHVNKVKRKNLIDAIGFCPQELKFKGNLSVIQALRVHAPLLSKDRAMEILEKMKLADWIKDSPHGLDTMLGNNAITLSGGQRARLAIGMLYAKIYYRAGALFLILDESLDALDMETANDILKALIQDLESGKLCLIVISHKIMILLENLKKDGVGIPYQILHVGNGSILKETEGEI